MRRTGKHVYFTKKEERAIFKCFYETEHLLRRDWHHENYRIMRAMMIEGTSVLTLDVWDRFNQVVVECGGPIEDLLAAMHGGKYDGQGAAYRVPSKEKDPTGHKIALARRTRWRTEFNDRYKPGTPAPTEEPSEVVDTFIRLRMMTLAKLSPEERAELERKEQEFQEWVESRKRGRLTVIDGGVR